MNELRTFNYGETTVRTTEINGEPWFVLKDVCEVLGLSDTNRTAERLDADELTRIKLVSGGQAREKIAMAGQKKVLQNYTYERQLKELMDWIKK